MNGIIHAPIKRGRGLAMGVTAALAGMLLIAVPAGAASAVEGAPGEDSVTTVETDVTPAEADVTDETGADAADQESEGATAPDPAEAAQAELEARAAEVPAAQAPASGADAPVAEAVATHTVSGNFKFGSMTLAQKKSIRVYLSEPNKPGKGYKVGDGLTLNTTTGAWSIAKVPAALYNITVYVDEAVSEYFPPVYMNGYKEYLDLRYGPKKVETIDTNLGAIRVGLVSPYTDAGRYKLYAINSSGVAKDVTNTVFAGDSSSSYPLRIHSLLLAPGSYKLRADLPNGIKIYYNGQPFGTEQASGAKSFTVTQLKQDRVSDLDLRNFSDVPASAKFYDDIEWLANEGITTGVNQPNGTLKFLPKDTVSREAMVAFLFRLDPTSGSYKAPSKSPFTDVKPGHKFYKQIMWAYDNKVTTGTLQPNGSRKFLPSDRITREAMAAFMYRQYKADISTKPGGQKLVDVPKGHKFYKEITWMSSNGITTGVKQPNGSLAFEPKDRTSREATAAFLHRAEVKK